MWTISFNFIDTLSQLFPGDSELGYRAFDHKMFEHLENSFLELQLVLSLFREFANSPKDEAGDLSDAIGFIKFLKKRDPVLYQNIIDEILHIYLKSDMHEGQLFERPYLAGKSRSLPDMNYDLLEPVIERGQIWRDDNIE